MQSQVLEKYCYSGNFIQTCYVNDPLFFYKHILQQLTGKENRKITKKNILYKEKKWCSYGSQRHDLGYLPFVSRRPDIMQKLLQWISIIFKILTQTQDIWFFKLGILLRKMNIIYRCIVNDQYKGWTYIILQSKNSSRISCTCQVLPICWVEGIF